MKISSGAAALGLALFLAASLGLQGCTGVVVGAGATAGVAAYSDRGIEGAAKDLKIEAAILGSYLEKDQMLPVNIGVEVYEGRALLTGVADSEGMRADAVKLAWTASGIKEILNEIQLAGGGAVNLAKDSWITAQLKTQVTFNRDIMAVNYVFETVNGTVYIIGIAQSQDELNRVIAHAREIDYVNNVISHVRVK
ncbi:MAG: BON domain-containing protein [Rhodospirillales bacterium]|nr:BON domain-containing protein [Alphaproteobacteria bacterium]MBL6928802.1 BON domain-containing protein [Rhodospirillales bacterium]